MPERGDSVPLVPRIQRPRRTASVRVRAPMDQGMSYQATAYEILIASPSDLVAEREAIPDVIGAWNALNSREYGIVLMPILWETHASPEMGDRPQAIINKQIVMSCDVLVGCFWTRIGTNTGVAESGTVEEIEEFLQAGKPVMLYFSSVPVVPDNLDADQYQRLREFRQKMEAQGFLRRYSTVSELRDKLFHDLTRTIRGLHKANTGVLLPEVIPEDPADAQRRQVAAVRQQLASVLNRREREWATEREVKPRKLDDAKRTLRLLAAEMLDLAALLHEQVDPAIVATLEEAVKIAKALQDHRVYFDGGVSYGQFWTEGDRIFAWLQNVLRKLA